MLKHRFRPMAAFFVLGCVTTVSAQQPTTPQFEQTLEAQLQKLKPQGTTVRTVRFEEVRPGRPNGGYYPFLVTASIHDYGPGYPANRYYGETCLGRMDKWKFDMLKDDFGGWIVQGRMTVSDAVCKQNPSAGVSSMPLASVAGSPAGNAPAPNPAASANKSPATTLYIGQWACYGVGSRLMAGMGFVLDRSGKYTDVDGGRGGNYSYNAGSSTIAFRGGFLDGQVGKNVRTTGFNISPTVSCEPWR
jgi:hypothetical protein